MKMDTEITLLYFMNKSSIWRESAVSYEEADTWSLQLTDRQKGEDPMESRVGENDGWFACQAS